jgi:outer membrane protein OmpA-like peptidoglycan-associated protein
MRKFMFFCVVAFLSIPGPTIAQVKSAEEIVDALKPKPLTRGLRGLRVEDEPKPTIDLTINFEFNSAKLSSDSQSQLSELGKALNSSELSPYRIKVTGHTDGVGSDSYNMDLSKRRAAAVVNFLSSQLSVSASRLISVGMGKRNLKFPEDPENGANRRVEITQLGEK